jgi:LysB family phage lysis regulatory protein
VIAVLERILVAVIVFLLAYLYVDHLQNKTATAERVAQQAESTITERNQAIIALGEVAKQKGELAARLEGERNSIRSQLGNREIEMRKLQNENVEVRAWAAAAVPEPVAGLRDHPTLTGAAAYREFLSKGAALPAAGGASEK